MGYDMYLKGQPLPDPEVPEGTPAWEAPRPNYFRLNIFGMSRWTAAMSQLGMLSEGGQPPSFAEAPKGYRDKEWEDMPVWFRDQEEAKLADHDLAGPGIPWWKFSSNDGWHVTAQECRQAVEAFAAHTEGQVKATLLETVDPGPDPERNKARLTGEMVINALGVVGVKMATEDGAEPGIDPEYWAEWIEFLRAGAAHDGFQVY